MLFTGKTILKIKWVIENNLIVNNHTEGVKDRIEILTEFFNDLPKIESHYCRARSSKFCLELVFESKSGLDKFYKSWCHEKSYTPVSDTLFSHIFNDMNLSLFKPKKEECDVCVEYHTENVSEENYVLHQFKKTESREAKEKNKIHNNRVFCMGVQAVILSPKSNTSALYFKMKLITHNFAVYDMKTTGYSFLWLEAESVCDIDYASIICYFLKDYVVNQLENDQVILYSDGCTSQNRNAFQCVE
ncbi:unnamed protein product [Psylliodes chrysocephalus]|uniref:Uncharacterized protein n=1 Tax=Psylliodes chrysocephalus TaxID=3402493 RepID=A0A9P0GBX1_9CUCU|nr:unnamed protein product [Psylliodes chrysocephala]